MAYFFTVGEQKVRPGIYQRYANRGSSVNAGSETGVVGITISSSWGPVGKVTAHQDIESVKKTYGTDGTVDAAIALLNSGAKEIYVTRLDAPNGGTAGTHASLSLVNSADLPETSVTIKAKYTGKRELNISVRAIDDTKKEIIVYSGTTKLESFSFDSGAETEEASNLVKAIAASDYITAEASLSTSDKTVAVVASEKLTGGTDPVITTESYSSALNLLEPYNFNYVTLDTTDEDATAILASWVERVMQTGKLVQAVVGCSYEKSLSERLAIAKSFNSMLVICSGIEGENANGEKPKDYIMSALVCGAIAGTPNTESIVHKAIPEITSIAPYTNIEYQDAICSGLLLASYSSNGTIWFDSGVNTLIVPNADQDDGWKKIRRVSTRFELMNRIDAATAPLTGKIDCDNDGIAIITERVQGVINDMITEGKLHDSSTIYEDPNNLHTSDSAWFIIEADDVDSFEKGYLTYMYRFDQNS